MLEESAVTSPNFIRRREGETGIFDGCALRLNSCPAAR
jgi:hypothetical protein